jgi:hypothetical protein
MVKLLSSIREITLFHLVTVRKNSPKPLPVLNYKKIKQSVELSILLRTAAGV